MQRILLLGLLLGLTACGGGGGDNPPTGGPWQGTWFATGALNADSRFVSCTGAFAGAPPAGLEGLLVIDPLDSVTCTAPGTVVTQRGTALTAAPITVTCSDGSSFTQTGSGTVSDTTGTVVLVSTEGTLRITEHFNVARMGDTVRLAEFRLEATDGVESGACNISPVLLSEATIVP